MKIEVVRDYDPDLSDDVRSDVDRMVLWAMDPRCPPGLEPTVIYVEVRMAQGGIPPIPLSGIVPGRQGDYYYVAYAYDDGSWFAVCQDQGECFAYLMG